MIKIYWHGVLLREYDDVLIAFKAWKWYNSFLICLNLVYEDK